MIKGIINYEDGSIGSVRLLLKRVIPNKIL